MVTSEADPGSSVEDARATDAALRTEIDRLRAEIDRLREEIRRLRRELDGTPPHHR